jgi:hypothetical protein
MKARATFQPRSEYNAWLEEKLAEQQARTVAVNDAE